MVCIVEILREVRVLVLFGNFPLSSYSVTNWYSCPAHRILTLLPTSDLFNIKFVYKNLGRERLYLPNIGDQFFLNIRYASFDTALPLFPKWSSKPTLKLAPENTTENATVEIECCCFAQPLADIRWMQRSDTDQQWQSLSGFQFKETRSDIRSCSSFIILAIPIYFLIQIRCICKNNHGEAISNATWFIFPGIENLEEENI